MTDLYKYLIIIALCVTSINTNAQDIITKKDGTDISAKVLEVTTTVIKYKRFENQNGPIISVKKSDILMIRYENGTKDVFKESVSDDNVSSVSENSNSNKVLPGNIGKGEMIIGEPIKFVKGFWMNKITQNGRKLNFKLVYRKLQYIDVCEENMQKSVKYHKLKIPFIIVGLVTFPAGYLLLFTPIIIFTNKEIKYFQLAIEDYNNSIK